LVERIPRIQQRQSSKSESNSGHYCFDHLRLIHKMMLEPSEEKFDKQKN